MAARQEVTLVISARDKTRAVFRRIRRGISRFRVGIGGLLAGGAFAAIARDALNAATEIEGASARLNVAGDDLEALRVLGDDLNITFQSLQTVMQRLSTNASRAAAGNEGLLEAFQELGIAASPRELRGLDSLQIFMRLADASATRNWSEIADDIAKIGDTEAVGLRGILEQGSPALARQIDELKQESGTNAEDRKKGAESEAALRRDLLIVQKELTTALVSLTPLVQEFNAIVGPLAKLFGDIVKAGQESGGFGLGAEAFDASQDPEATLKSAIEFGIKNATPLQVINNIQQELVKIAANTETFESLGGRFR